jgi:flagellin
MANIGTTTAFYKVESSLTRANNEVSKSMERLATGRQNANAGDRSSYVAMSDTFRLDFVGTKAGIKGASVAMGYLETGMRVLDAASSLLSRLQELAVLGANDTNTIQDHEAINLEAEALGDEFNRLMTTSAYKGKNVFVDNASSEYVSVGGRNAEMTFGIGKLTYTELYDTERTISFTGGPNDAGKFNLVALPSDGVNAKPTKFGLSSNIIVDADGATALTASKSYVVRDSTGKELDLSNQTNDDSTDSLGDALRVGTPTIAMKTKAGVAKTSGNIADGDVITRTAAGTVTFAADDTGNGVTTGRATLAEVNTENAFVVGLEYEIASLGTGDGTTGTAGSDAAFIKAAATNLDDTAISGTFVVGSKFLVKSAATTEQMAGINSLIQGMTFRRIGATNELTQDIEAIQAKINTARVQAGSQYAAMESAVDYTTDLTAQYELGFNTVNDVNFSMETAHLAKNQILQQAATAMLAQANQGQQGLLQLIQG